jgi:hypothetical protein
MAHTKSAVPKPYVYKPWPAWRYHADGRSVIVQSATDETALGPGWSNRPPSAQVAKTGPAPPPLEAPGPRSVAEAYYAAPAAKILAQIKAVPTEGLQEAMGLERAHPKYPNGRKAVLKALEAELTARDGGTAGQSI